MKQLLWSFLLGSLTLAATAQGYRTLVPEAGIGGASRVALVIGNSAYNNVSSLQNPMNDANDMAATLRRLGFVVIVGTDLSYEQMDEAISSFTQRLFGAEVGLFFFAGHGVQVDGQNFLVPVDANIRQASQVKYRAVHAGEVLESMEEAGSALNIMILDACRNNPFRGWRSGGGGLSAMNGPGGSIIAYATGPGSIADDNQAGRNGLYTSTLLKYIEEPGIEVSRMLRLVTTEVRDRSDGKQEPWMAASYGGDFFFREGTGSLPPPVLSVDAVIEQANAAYDQEDFEEALRLYLRVADRAPAWVQYRVGHMYRQGKGVAQDDEKAVHWYLKSAEQEHAWAQTQVGFMYLNGYGVAKNYAEAVRWYRRAVSQGDAAGQYSLGYMYENGLGVLADMEDAVGWYRKAAQQGHENARKALERLGRK
ncbi:MAG: caspase family protein [Rhodothermales bacterium]